MVQGLRALAVLAEDPGSVPSTAMPVNRIPGDPEPISGT